MRGTVGGMRGMRNESGWGKWKNFITKENISEILIWVLGLKYVGLGICLYFLNYSLKLIFTTQITMFPNRSYYLLTKRSELKTLELDTFNLNHLIWISNVNTFNFLLNQLFFLFSPCQFPTNESSPIKWRAKFQNLQLLWLAVLVSPNPTWLFESYTFVDTNLRLN